MILFSPLIDLFFLEDFQTTFTNIFVFSLNFIDEILLKKKKIDDNTFLFFSVTEIFFPLALSSLSKCFPPISSVTQNVKSRLVMMFSFNQVTLWQNSGSTDSKSLRHRDLKIKEKHKSNKTKHQRKILVQPSSPPSEVKTEQKLL